MKTSSLPTTVVFTLPEYREYDVSSTGRDMLVSLSLHARETFALARFKKKDTVSLPVEDSVCHNFTASKFTLADLGRLYSLPMDIRTAVLQSLINPQPHYTVFKRINGNPAYAVVTSVYSSGNIQGKE